MLIAGCLPDADGVSLLGGWRLYRSCHRMIGHGIVVTLFGPALLAWLGSALMPGQPVLPLWFWLQMALFAHLLTDVLFYRWPVQLLWPFSSRGWAGGLVAWNDLVPTLVLYVGTALCLLCPHSALLAAISLGLLCAYLGWRAVVPRSQHGWLGWLTGDWAPRAAPFWRWCTGDFIT
jgi:membrane-bound metal-dependent hydrolase YbcI (DUF457 family)